LDRPAGHESARTHSGIPYRGTSLIRDPPPPQGLYSMTIPRALRWS